MLNKKLSTLVVFFIIFAIPIILRFIALDADQPADYLSGISEADEGVWPHNARNKILYGVWVTDKWNPIFMVPFFTLIQYVFFYLFGVGIVQARLVSVVFSILSLLMLYKSLKMAYNKKIAMLATFMMSYNIFYFMFSRSALIETPLMFFMITAFYFWVKSLKKPIYFFPLVVTLFLAFLTKTTSIMFVLGVVFCFAFYLFNQFKIKNKGDFRNSLFYFSAGIFLCSAIYFIFYFIPNYGQIKESLIDFGLFRLIGSSWGVSTKYGIMGIKSAILSIVYKLILFGNLFPIFAGLPLLTVIFSIFILYYLSNLMSDFNKETNKIDFFVFIWFAFGILFIFVFEFGLRRILPLTVPMAIFASKSFENGITIKLRPKKLWNKIILLVVLFFILHVLFSTAIKYLLFFNIANFVPQFESILMKVSPQVFFLVSKLAPITKISLVASLFSLLISVPSFLLIVIKVKEFRFDIRNHVVSLMALIFLIFFIQYLSWFSQLDYTYISISRDIGRILPERIKVQGSMASAFSLENKIFPIFIGEGYANYRDMLNRTDVKYVITYIYPGKGYETGMMGIFMKNYPNAKLIKQWRFSEKMQNQTTGVYEYSYVGLFDKYPDQNITEENFFYS